MKIVRAIREGRIQPYKSPEERAQEEDEEEEEMYDLWANEQAQPPHVMHIPAPKVAPPGFDLSYKYALLFRPTAFYATNDNR